MLVATASSTTSRIALRSIEDRAGFLTDRVAALRRQGRHVLDPASGRLTGQDTGPGRLPDPEAIRDAALALVAEPARTPTRPSLSGLRAVVSTGGTQEPLDPVRFLGNRSSGRMGMAVARAARDLGAEVTLLQAAVEVPAPEGVRVVEAVSAAELEAAVAREFSDAGADLLVGGYEFVEEVLDESADLIADRADRVNALAGWVVESPVPVADAGEHRARIATAHGDHDVGGFDGVGGEDLG